MQLIKSARHRQTDMTSQPRISLGYRMIELLNRKFEEFDADKNGVLTLNEILTMSDTNEDDAKLILEHFDMNGDDQIEREEFKHVGLLLLSNQQFKSHDKDGNGFLSKEEFAAALTKLNYEGEQIERIFKRADMDRSGSIDRFEFLNALMHMISPEVDESSLDISAAWKEDRQGRESPESDVTPSQSKEPIAKKAATKGKKKSALKKTNLGLAGKTKRRKKRKERFSAYIYKVLRQVHPDTGISSQAMSIMDSFVHDVFERLAGEASRLTKTNNKATLSSREIQTAVRLLLPGELAKHAVSEGTKAVTKFTATKL